MKKLVVFFIAALVSLVAIATMSLAAVTGCINAYTYNDTGTPTNVSAGKVCYNATDYDVAPNASVNCNDTWANYTNGACMYSTHYVGYAGDGTTTCVATGWVVKDATVVLPEGYIINTTVNAATNAAYETHTGVTTPAKNACLNAYTRMGPTGYCNGQGGLDTNSSTSYVAAGKVCSAGSNVAPNSTAKCGTWSNCVAGQSTADEYYVGYSGSGSACSATAWVAAGTKQTAPNGQEWTTTGAADTCSTVGHAVTGIKNTKVTLFAAFGLLAVLLLVLAAWGVVHIFQSGDVDLTTLAVTLIGGAVVLFIAYIVVYYVATALGG